MFGLWLSILVALHKENYIANNVIKIGIKYAFKGCKKKGFGGDFWMDKKKGRKGWKRVRNIVRNWLRKKGGKTIMKDG